MSLRHGLPPPCVVPLADDLHHNAPNNKNRRNSRSSELDPTSYVVAYGRKQAARAAPRGSDPGPRYHVHMETK
nr:unnamed protein product [Digitaria exilis]